MGLIYPARFLAVQIVRDMLTGFRMDPSLFPIKELADHSVDWAKMQARINGKWYRNYLREAAETTAWSVFYITTGGGFWSAAEIKEGIDRGIPNIVWQILAKHDPKRFSLDELEITQMTNTMLLQGDVKAK